jgi:hypothetical protein
VWPLLVVLDHPPPGRFPDVVEAQEQVLVEDLLAEGPVEALGLGVLVRLAGLDVPDRKAMVLGPADELLAEELGPVVDPQYRRQPALRLEVLEDADQAHGGNRGVYLDVKCLAIEVVDDVEQPESPATGQPIAHEVGRPYGVGSARHVQRRPLAFGQPTACGAAQVQAHARVDAVDALVVPAVLPPQDLAALPEPAAGPILHQPPQGTDDLRIAYRPIQGRVVPRRARKADTVAGSPHGPLVDLNQVPHGLALVGRPYSFLRSGPSSRRCRAPVPRTSA